MFEKTNGNIMLDLIWLLGGVVVGAAAVGLWLRARLMSLQALMRVREDELVNERARMDMLDRENRQLTAARQVLEKELEMLREQMARDDEARNKRFTEQLRLVQEQLQNATREMLGQRSNELTQRNNEQMAAIIDPLKDTIREMRTAMDHSRDSNNKNTASLEKAIEEVMKRTTEVGLKADNLATALRNENKVQGNWGELILDELLESQGLTEGVHYEKQVLLRDCRGEALLNGETGRRMIPDVILHYPDGKDAIIDSKVSLAAFVDYRNAETEEERDRALERHLKSLRSHVAELVRKDYSSYIKAPRQALNYVIMFVPNEAALQLALNAVPSLWHEAFSKGVFITGEQNLAAALRIIQIAWTQMQQARNQEAIFDTARMLLDRVADFIKYMDEVGKKLQDATNSYTKAADKLRDGRLSVVGASNKLLKLGAKTSPSKVIPEENEPLREIE